MSSYLGLTNYLVKSKCARKSGCEPRSGYREKTFATTTNLIMQRRKLILRKRKNRQQNANCLPHSFSAAFDSENSPFSREIFSNFEMELGNGPMSRIECWCLTTGSYFGTMSSITLMPIQHLIIQWFHFWILLIQRDFYVETTFMTRQKKYM